MQAVAAHAGFQVSRPEVDDDSVDGILLSRRGRRPRIEFQLKATGQDIFQGDHVAFPLPIKNYNDLQVETISPRILVVVSMPDNEAQWLHQSEEALHLYRCAYWVSLLGRPETPNTASITVHLPGSQMFTSESLVAMMDRIQAGGVP